MLWINFVGWCDFVLMAGQRSVYRQFCRMVASVCTNGYRHAIFYAEHYPTLWGWNKVKLNNDETILFKAFLEYASQILCQMEGMEFTPCLPAETILGITISLRESIGTYPIQKNFLFFGSHAGTKRDSDFYSLACRLHKINFLETCPTFSTEKTYSIRYSKSIFIIP